MEQSYHFLNFLSTKDSIDLINMHIGDPFTSKANIYKVFNNPTWYVISNWVKRGITSPAVLEKYHFDPHVSGEFTSIVREILLDFIPTGANGE